MAEPCHKKMNSYKSSQQKSESKPPKFTTFMKHFLLRMSLGLVVMAVSVSVFAQTTVSGRLTAEETGDPLIGATVLVKGTSNGTITDLNGDFSLSAPSGATLIISYIGFETQEISADADLSSLSMQSSSVGLGEVMVIASVGIDRTELSKVSELKMFD